MRSSPIKTDKKTLVKGMKSVPVQMKKKKLTEIKSPLKDTITETISFVIKGELTPIKPTPILTRISKSRENKIQMKRYCATRSNIKLEETPKRVVKVRTKAVKIPTNTKSLNKKNVSDVSKTGIDEMCKTKKKVGGKKVQKNLKEIIPDPKKITKKPPARKNKAPPLSVKNIKETGLDLNKNDSFIDDEIKKQKTIEKLLKEANKVLRTKSVSKKNSVKKKAKRVKKCTTLLAKNKIISPKLNIKKSNKKEFVDNSLKNKQRIIKENNTSQIETSPVLKETPLKRGEIPANEPTGSIAITDIKKEPSSDSECNKKIQQIKKQKKILIKKQIAKNKRKFQEEQKRRAKLYSFWNGPKRHRVASLNAIAKVHCLYENETKGNILDKIDDSTVFKREPKKESKELTETSSDTEDRKEENVPSTRILRCLPGLRAVGKHWDMHESTSSSSEENSGYESLEEVVTTVTKPKIKKESAAKKTEQKTDMKKPTETKRRRNKPELVMDLKDMVVRKRMASLNASAILAASYSSEKRTVKSSKSDDSSYYDTDSSDDYFAASDQEEPKKKKFDDIEIKKEDDKKLIEVHTTPNKKVAVILNQDTDVTITGVYVNSTTRSTHHEGYCSIAGMQYRISATSHTQTAATAVATETLLQPSSSSGPENTNSDSQPSSKSYTPLDALSNMQPPPGPGIQHNHPVQHHVLPMTPHQLSPGVRHNCSSAFSSPHATPSYQQQQPPSHHHPPVKSGEPGYVHGYYQPAGPLISLPHGHGQPVPPPIAKSVPLSDASPVSTTPPMPPHHPPPPPSSNGDSSDSEVIITSVTTGTKEPISPAAHPPTSYRYSQYPAGPPPYTTYSYPPYHYPTPPPPNPPYAHHDLCYPAGSYVHPKYTSYRRMMATAPYYPGSPQEIYASPPAGPAQPSQQVVTATPVSSSGTSFSQAPNGPPPPQLPSMMETYPAPPPPTLVETYQAPPHYYPPAYGLPPSCYTHSPTRAAIPYINATYQSCPCPMQSCPKNVLTGPLTGDSKRSNISSISKDSMPLPPVALALPLEPASATGPPSPARGSAGMPPPPSPAGAVYQPPPPAPKQESHSPEVGECKIEKKKKARIGKAMVRSNMQNTMLLMCNPNQNYVKREIESPKEKEDLQKKEICSSDEESKIPVEEPEIIREPTREPSVNVVEEEKDLRDNNLSEEKVSEKDAVVDKVVVPQEDPLPPCIATVAENVKVKNMKRKQSMTKEQIFEEVTAPPRKKPKLGSYKDFIKKDTNCFKIDNGKRKLIDKTPTKSRIPKLKFKKLSSGKRKLNCSKEPVNAKRMELSTRPLLASNFDNFKQTFEETESIFNKRKKNHMVTLKSANSKSAVKVLDNLFAKNNVDRIIETVISESIRTSPCVKQEKSVKNRQWSRKITNKCGQVKVKNMCKKTGASRRKSVKCREVIVPQVIARIPRRSIHVPRWSNGWRWEGEPYDGKVFLNSDETTVIRKCYPAMRHDEGDQIVPRDCVLLKAGPRKNDLPYVAKIAYLWENPEDGEMMMSLLWYYRPEHTEQGRLPTDQQDEVFASRHKDSNSVACIDDKCYVLTFNEYCRYRKRYKRLEEGIEEMLPCIPVPEPYPRSHRQPPSSSVSPDMVFFCRKVYDFRQKRIVKNPT